MCVSVCVCVVEGELLFGVPAAHAHPRVEPGSEEGSYLRLIDLCITQL